MSTKVKHGGAVIVTQELLCTALGIEGATIKYVEFDVLHDALRLTLMADGEGDTFKMLGVEGNLPVALEGQWPKLLSSANGRWE